MDTTKIYPSLFARNAEMPVKRILWAFGYSAEFDSRKNPEIQIRETDGVEVPKLVREFPELEVTLPRKSKKAKRQRLPQPLYTVKAQALMYAHLSRMKLSPSLDADRIYVVIIWLNVLWFPWFTNTFTCRWAKAQFWFRKWSRLWNI